MSYVQKNISRAISREMESFISREKLAKKTLTDENRPDYIIHRFIDVLDLPILQKGGDRA